MRSEHVQPKRLLRRLALSFLGALIVLASLPFFATEALALQVNVQRVAGDTRYDTMAELISNVGGWNASDKVILASGANYPDALSASALAGVHDAPIILTDPTGLSSKAADTIKQLRPSTIYVVGGPSAVSDAVLQAATNICGSTTIRLYGSTRYETSLEILRQCNFSSDTVIVVTGANYADSLSISPFAYVTKSPIVLCDPYGGLTQEAIEAIRAGGFSRAILVGGNAAVPDVVISQLNNANIATDGIRRLSGATRYETSTQITAFEISETSLFTADPLGFATGSNYADALAMGPCMGRINSPLLLVDNGAQTVCTYIERFKGNVGNAFVAGGINAVSNDDYQRIVVALTPNDTSPQPKPSPTDLSGAQVKVPQQQYTGQPLTPAPEVTLGDQKLKQDVDYNVSYSNNTNVGTATVTVTGINRYTGVAKGTFEIVKKPSVSKQNVNVPSPAKLTYNGSNQTGVASSSSYTVKNGTATNAGAYKATLTLKDKTHYQWASTGKSDDVTVNWSIAAASLSGAKVNASSQTFTGQALNPGVTVKLGNRTLKSGTDYTVSYSNNTNAGTAKVIVTGKGNYTGTANGSFTISPAGLAGAKVSAANQTFSGKTLSPSVTVKLGNRTLSNGTDYSVSYSNNLHAGTAKATVTGKGNYTGTASGSFTISPAGLSGAKVSVGSQKYTGSQLTPAPTVTLGGKTLKNGTDYTTSYSNNVKVGTATVTVAGKGDYTGTAKTTFAITASKQSINVPSPAKLTFNGSYQTAIASNNIYTVKNGGGVNAGSYRSTLTLKDKNSYQWASTGKSDDVTVSWSIYAASLSGAKVSATNQTFNGQVLTPGVTVKLGNRTLTNGTDYTVSYSNNTNAGTAKVNVTGKGNYTGTASGSFTIYPASISGASVSAANQTFNGQALTPGITVKLGGHTLSNGTDFSASYSNNLHAGTANVSVTGKGNYSGTVRGSFTISRASISGASISVPAQNYTGSQLTPVPVVTLNGRSLESGTDFTTSYSNNVKVGTANITITGKGDYTGTAASTFKITRGQATVKKVKVGEITVTVYSYPDGYSYVDVPDQWLSISTCNNTNRCVDVAAVSKDNGANVQLWDNNGVTGQIWKFVEESEGVYRIKNAYSNKYLSLDSSHKNEEGCNVLQLSSSSGGDQLWRAEVYNNKLMLINVHSNYILDCYGGYADNGTNIQVWSRNNSKAQLFVLKPESIRTKGTRTITVGNVSVTEHTYDNGDRYYEVSEGMYIIQSCSGSNQVLDVVGGGKDNGVNVNSWSSNGTNWQKWQFVRAQNGIYKVINVNSGKCLEVAGQDTNVNGGNVQQWDYVGGNNQKWKLWLTKDNKLVFLNLATQRALNITGDTATNGANVTIQDRNLSANQSWTLRRTSKQIDPNEECNRISVETWNAVREYRQKNGLYVPGGNDTYCDGAASYSASHCAAAGKMTHDYRREYDKTHSLNGWQRGGECLATAHAGETGKNIVNRWWDDVGHPDLGHRKALNFPGMRVCGVKTSYNANTGTYYISMVYAGYDLGQGGIGGSKL